MSNNKKTLTYKIIVNKDTRVSESFFTKNVDNILTDPRTWKNYKFKRITDPKVKPYFLIILCRPEVIKKTCGFHGLSCTNMKTKVVWINSNRYKRGAQKSGYNLTDYRIYLINHEVGHVLGKHHTKCSDKPKGGSDKVPVMNQATKGIGKCKPNVWPLEYENY
jgi:hypothetical protein